MSWTQNGYCNWQNAKNNITAHEISTSHTNSSVVLKINQTTLPVLPSLEYARKMQVSTNRQIVSQLIDIVCYLAKHQLAFRGHREAWSENIKGNFKDLVELIASHSPVLSSHISLIKLKGRKELSFVSSDKQNQLISSVAENISNKIQLEILAAKLFSISIDSTFDSSRKEQISFIVRYANDNSGTVYERLIALKESDKTTGKVLFKTFEDVMIREGFEWKTNLIGQSYDGASNMSGEYNGLQAHIKEKNNHATFIWCHAHRLNLVVVAATSKGIDTLNLFGNLESLYSFLWCTKKRVSIFRQKQSELYKGEQIHSMKRVATTRWMSHATALNTVHKKFDAIIETLEEIRQVEGLSDVKVVSAVSGFLNYFKSSKFLYTSFFFKTIFDVLEPHNNVFQKCDIDLLTATDLLISGTCQLKYLRNNNKEFKNIIADAEHFKTTIHTEFEPLKEIRKRKVPRQFDEEQNDEPIMNSLKEMKINTFYFALDITIAELETRFNNNQIGILRDLSLFSEKRIIELNKHPKKLPIDAFKMLCSIYQFLSIEELKTEYMQFVRNYFDLKKSIDMPTRIHNENTIQCDSDLDNITNSDSENEEEAAHDKTFQNSGCINNLFKMLCLTKMNSVFPNLFIAIKISVTLPVSSSSTERTFSKLKLIKTRLRTTTSENRLEDLMKISCEQDIEINKEDVINIFASKTPASKKALIF